jgi:hypothetical protein
MGSPVSEGIHLNKRQSGGQWGRVKGFFGGEAPGFLGRDTDINGGGEISWYVF